MSRPMIPSERAEFSAIVDRPPLKLPGDARIVFWTIVNLEVWDIASRWRGRCSRRRPGRCCCPTCRTGAGTNTACGSACWRFFDLFERLGIKPTLAVNARVCEDYPRVAEQAKKDGWEFMGHAYEQVPIHKNDDQAAMIDRSMDVIEKFTGKRPVGWLGPGPDADARDAGAAGRGRRAIHRRLGL